MAIHTVDLAIVIGYLLLVVISGVIFSRKAAENIDSYFLGGRKIPWYMLGVSNASGMFDITGTMWTVTILFVYGLKSVWLPWLWPVWNQIFMMVYLSIWMRRSRVVTGAEWLETRFSRGLGLNLSHLSTVLFAVITVIGMIAYAFEGIGKFSTVFLPWDLSPQTYALIILGTTTIYVTVGGMYSVVLTDLVQFVLMTVVSIWIGILALRLTSDESIAAAVPAGWDNIFFGWTLDLDWSSSIQEVQTHIGGEALYHMFGAFVMLCILKGVLASAAGPTPGYDMQRVLATRSPREAALMSGIVTPVLMLPRYFLVAGVAALALVNFSSDLLTKPESAVVQAKTIALPIEAVADQTSDERQPEVATNSTVDFEQILPFVISKFMPVGLVGLVLAGLLAAFMSTFDSTVNAGAAYLVNDIYKRYLHPQATGRQQILMSYVCSLAVVVAGIALGYQVRSIDQVLQWITAGLYGGYVAPNVLKWYWWRLNGVGYFTGMVSGTSLALAQASFKHLDFVPDEPLHAFPVILMFSGIATVLASLLSRPEDDETLKSFYRNVRPWGFWGPIHAKCIDEDPSIEANGNFSRDMVNCFVGTVWQTAIIALPIYVMIRKSNAIAIALTVIVFSSVVLKLNWYDKIDSRSEDG